MPIQIGEKPSPTFDKPLELLSDCHRRVERFLDALILVTEQAQGKALNAKQREALVTALRYFREAAPKHTADEEDSLFPRMREADSEEVQTALAKIDALESDHRVAKQAHESVNELGERWLEQGWLIEAETASLLDNLRQLHSIYERHIAIEDAEIFPLAGKILQRKQLDDVGREMAERRGQDVNRRLRWKA